MFQYVAPIPIVHVAPDLGILSGGLETFRYFDDWPVHWIVVEVAVVMFLVGLSGTAIMWRRETRNSYRAAIRRKNTRD
jgi:hypothetical protein